MFSSQSLIDLLLNYVKAEAAFHAAEAANKSTRFSAEEINDLRNDRDSYKSKLTIRAEQKRSEGDDL